METNDVRKIADYISDKGFCRIGVDGTNGSGKSTLDAALASTLGICHLNLDDFLVKKQGGFLEHLKYGEVKQNIISLDCFVIEGICLLRVLEEVNSPVECLVYVKRMCHGLWADECECEVADDVEEYIEKEKDTIRLIEQSVTIPDTLGIAEEIIRYHNEYKPQQKAELFYTREDC